ncbi:glyoxalase/bleomycin resistance/extradiol dioxygenase family protein [Bacteroides sp. AF34-31BH]|uniref:VOC family protein n=1 Tax=Bacteroides sp. AF34-31BH TaxID=2292931 RepID=UPI000E72106E|nr:VOC family protein [Bacteroides sp. AF34-31BH]RJV08733.1 glyoxalase/bleomycin resistance/extradiol dioxygenase family protein [Bacteroides sp. AF34-31BH]
MKIDHLAIWAEDLELLKDFYTKYFDMDCGKMYHNPKKNFSSYFLRSAEGGAAIELMNIPGKDAPASRGDLKGLAHFAISVGSKEKVDSYAERFRADSYTILSAPRITGDGYYECAIADPEGNYVEVVA